MFTPGAVFFLTVWLIGMSNQLGDLQDWVTVHEETTDKIIAQAGVERSEHLRKMNENGDKMDQILQVLEQNRIDLLTIIGQGGAGDFGLEDAFIRINRGSDRVRYQDGERVRVTLKDGSTSVVLPINGTFDHPDEDLILVFSSKACGDLGVVAAVEVKMEPLN